MYVASCHNRCLFSHSYCYHYLKFAQLRVQSSTARRPYVFLEARWIDQSTNSFLTAGSDEYAMSVSAIIVSYSTRENDLPSCLDCRVHFTQYSPLVSSSIFGTWLDDKARRLSNYILTTESWAFGTLRQN